jgi:hypothetical protein
MKLFKIIFVFVMALTFTNNVVAQEKLEEKAKEMAKEYNQKLGDYPLTSVQEEQLSAIFLEKLKEIKEIKNEEETDEVKSAKIKEVHKNYAKRISDEILTKEQKTALKAFNANKKE